MPRIFAVVTSFPDGGSEAWSRTRCAPCTTIARSPPVCATSSNIDANIGTTAKLGITFGPRPS